MIREHTEQMKSPRFLWVPFELGRPFGAPHEPVFQKRVLHAALALLERADGPVILEDFPDEAPPTEKVGEASWSCPVRFAPPAGERPPLVTATLEEMARLAPWHELYVKARGRSRPSASGLGREAIVALLERLAEGETEPALAGAAPLHELVRLACDDLRTWYLEAAQAQPGAATAARLRDWFWYETAFARLIARVAAALARHPDPMVQVLALRALVPREVQKRFSSEESA